MSPRTDTRARVVRASLELMRRQGFGGTSISDIVEEAKAPRGSVTFHFPGGKEEIAVEVVDQMTRDILVDLGNATRSASTPAAVVQAHLRAIGDAFAASDWVAGCPVVPIAIELSGRSEAVRRGCAHFFEVWRMDLARRLEDRGLDAGAAQRIAELTVYAAEGALVACRSTKDRAPLDAVAAGIGLLCEAMLAPNAGSRRAMLEG